MKILFTFLGILLLYLSCIPCSDSQECDADAVTKISSSGDHQRHNHTNEDCSPFCTCSCCAASPFAATPSKIVIVSVVEPAVKFSLSDAPVYAGAHYSIWQPPKNA